MGAKLIRYAYAIALAVDLLASAVTGGAPLQTLSARFAKARRQGSWLGTIAADATDWSARVLFGESNHCDVALAAYEAREAAASSWARAKVEK